MSPPSTSALSDVLEERHGPTVPQKAIGNCSDSEMPTAEFPAHGAASPSRRNVLVCPMLLISVDPRKYSNVNAAAVRSRNCSLTWMRPGNPSGLHARSGIHSVAPYVVGETRVADDARRCRPAMNANAQIKLLRPPSRGWRSTSLSMVSARWPTASAPLAASPSKPAAAI